MNQAHGIKFPIKVDLTMHAHKRSLILQAELGGVEFPSDEHNRKHKSQFNQDKTLLFSHVHRLINCVIDCQTYLQDAVATRHALELARSFSSRVWENSPYQMKQIPRIGLVAIRKLAMGGINSIEALEAAEPNRIEMLMSRNPPFGQMLLGNLKEFPKLRVALKLMGTQAHRGRPLTITIKVECGFINERPPIVFHGKPFNVCLLTERSDGHLVDFKRLSAKHLTNGKELLVSAELVNHTHYITCHVMCDTIAGTLRSAELKPNLPAHLFPAPEQRQKHTSCTGGDPKYDKGRQVEQTSPATLDDDDFGEDEIKDQDMVDVVTAMDFCPVDKCNLTTELAKQILDPNSRRRKQPDNQQDSWVPEKLDNGKWACNHKCKDKKICKHLCCREGVDKAPKPPKSAFISAATALDRNASTQLTKLSAHSAAYSKQRPRRVETLDLAVGHEAARSAMNPPKELIALQRLHQNVVQDPAAPVVSSKKPLNDYIKETQCRLASKDPMTHTEGSSSRPSTDYDDEWIGNLSSPSALIGKEAKVNKQVAHKSSGYGSGWDDNVPSPTVFLHQNESVSKDCTEADSLEDFDISQFNNDYERIDMEATMVGLNDSITMNDVSQTRSATYKDCQDQTVANKLPTVRHDISLSDPCPHESSHTSNMLFLSTDSPEKPADSGETCKRSQALLVNASSPSAPVPKRQRIANSASASPQASSSAAGAATNPAPAIKPGQPDWVYDFDPAFIAEWQYFVDFI